MSEIYFQKLIETLKQKQRKQDAEAVFSNPDNLAKLIENGLPKRDVFEAKRLQLSTAVCRVLSAKLSDEQVLRESDDFDKGLIDVVLSAIEVGQFETMKLDDVCAVDSVADYIRDNRHLLN